MKQDALGSEPIQPEERRQGWLRRALLGRGSGRAARPEPAIPAALAPSSALMEACRTLLVNLGPALPAQPPVSLLLLGLAPAPACALTAAGVALALAEVGRTTLLVDADLRRPLVHAIFGADLSPGLADALAAPAAPVAPAVVGAGLRLLPAGAPAGSPAELFRRPALGALTRQLAGAYDAVVYALGGGLDGADAQLLAAHVAPAVLLVRSGADSAADVQRAQQLLERAGGQLAGFAMVE